MLGQYFSAVRIVLASLAGAALLSIAAVGSKLWQHSATVPPGSALGQSLPQPGAWAGKHVLLGGADGTTMQLWSSESGLTPLQGFAAKAIVGATVASDASAMLLAERQDTSVAFWMLDAGGARIITTLTGRVSMLRFSPDARFASFLWQQPNRTVFDLHVLDVKNGSVQRVADDSVDAQWLPRAGGLLSVNPAGELRYHALLLTGTFDAPQLLATIVGRPAVLPLDRILFFRAATPDQPPAVVSLDIIRKEQLVVAPLAVPPVDGAGIFPDPAGQRAVLLMPAERAQANWPAFLLTLANGQLQPLSVGGQYVRWSDADHVLLAQPGATAAQVLFFAVDEGTSFPLPGENQHLLP